MLTCKGIKLLAADAFMLTVFCQTYNPVGGPDLRDQGSNTQMLLLKVDSSDNKESKIPFGEEHWMPSLIRQLGMLKVALQLQNSILSNKWVNL